MSHEIFKKKQRRKRSKNTSSEQYELYLKALETDETFRASTVNPVGAVAPTRYLENQWVTLTNSLNAIHTGAMLSVTEWQKRFYAWKKSTRSKFRRLTKEKLRAEGNTTEVELNLSPLEKRGLMLWGIYGGSTNSNKVPLTDVEIKSEPTNDLLEDFSLTSNDAASSSSLSLENVERRPFETIIVEPTDIANFDFTESSSSKKSKQENTSNRLLPLIEEKLLNAYRESTAQSEKSRQLEIKKLELQERQLQLETKKFKFEVAKWKFQHPTFDYKDDL